MKIAAAILAMTLTATAATPDAASLAVNQLGLDLYRKLPAAGNLCISPYSIQSALAMTYAGASGATRAEMERVLHYAKGDDTIHASFAALQNALAAAAEKSVKLTGESKRYGGPSEPITLNIANRLFGQKDYEFRTPFTSLVKSNYGAPFALMDFKKNAAGATREINNWVSGQTRNRIRDLIPPRALDETTRLVLVNALYFKAAWADEFSEHATKKEPFHVNGGATENVPTMTNQSHYRYTKGDGFAAVGLPYIGGDLQFIVIVPDEVKGAAGVEAKLKPATLAACAKAEQRDVILHLPKFKIEPPTVPLSKALQQLGMKTAFDIPAGSADFDRMAPRRPDDYLFVSEVFHKTFIALDEKGTEAAAATAVAMAAAGAAPGEPPKPIEVRVDRPFLFAIQHVPSGACLFLGRVMDPK
ncbi:MAG: hypothetical protein RL088_2399 [Verrucomicrobiota bacterium]|jgi:serpin B